MGVLWLFWSAPDDGVFFAYAQQGERGLFYWAVGVRSYAEKKAKAKRADKAAIETTNATKVYTRF